MASPAWKRLGEGTSTSSILTGPPNVPGPQLDGTCSCCAFWPLKMMKKYYLSHPDSKSVKAPSLPRDGQAPLWVTQDGKASPGTSQSETLNLLPPARRVSSPSSSKPPPTPASHIRLGLQKEEDLGLGVGAPRLPADRLQLLGLLGGDARGQLGGWALESLAGPSPADLSVCTCTMRAGCSAAQGSISDRRWGWAKACTSGWGLWRCSACKDRTDPWAWR